MLKEFFQDMKSYGKESKWFGIKWMKFDFYFRQPVNLLLGLASIIYNFLQSHYREDYITLATMSITWLILILLFFLCMIRRKYSFRSLIAILLLQSLGTAAGNKFSVWAIVLAIGLFFILLSYYYNRKDFFKKREAADINKKNAIVGSTIGLLLVVAIIVLFLCIKEQIYLKTPAKDTKCIVSASDDTWTKEQAGAVADKWLDAVVKKDTEGMQEIIEKMLIEQEKKVKVLFFFEKSEFRAGIDSEKCSNVLACIDAKEQGLAYYSLARIGHYYDTRTSRNHKISVLVERKEEEICVVLQHGKAKTELDFVDMNEVIGEDGRENLRQKDFSDEDITSVLGNIYTDEDISFVKELAKAVDKKAYAQVFKKDPDKLSAVGQDALYQYAYVLMSNGIECDRFLHVTKQDLGHLEVFSNGILQTLSNNKKENYCERYLKILGDKGEYRMNVVADQMQKEYREKEAVVDHLPAFSFNSQLNILFNAIEFRINEERSYRSHNAMQVRDFGIVYGGLLRNCIEYWDDIFIDGEKTEYRVMIDKYTGNDTYAADIRSGTEPSPEEAVWTSLYGDTITCNRRVMLRGRHDANTVLKEAWLKNEGLSFMATPELKEAMEREFYPEQEEDSRIFSSGWLYNLPLKRDEVIPVLYLAWSGKPYEFENGEKSRINDLNSFSVLYMVECMSALESISSSTLADERLPYYSISESTYKEYNVISDYYLKSEEDVEENNSSATKEEISEEVTEEVTALQEEKEDSGKVEGYEYLKQIDLPSADGNVYPIMVPKNFVLEEGDRFVTYHDNGFYLSMYARELFEGETLADFMDLISDFIYEDPDRDYFINVNKTDRIEKDGLIYQICTADGLHSDGTTSPHARLAAAIPLGGTDILAFHLEYDKCNQEGIKYLEEIGKYYKIPVDLFIELMEENE